MPAGSFRRRFFREIRLIYRGVSRIKENVDEIVHGHPGVLPLPRRVVTAVAGLTFGLAAPVV